MPTDKIDYTDTLRIGTGKINDAIVQANKSEVDAAQAVSTSSAARAAAQAAEAKSDSTQTQLDTIIIESGTSDAETIQARGGEPLLNDRLNKTDQQLAEKVNHSEARLKSSPIGLNDASPEMLAAIEGGGGTSFNLETIPRDSSVTPEKTTFIQTGVNSFDKSNPDVIIDKYYSPTNVLTTKTGWGQSGFIPVEQGADYTSTSTVFHVNWYGATKNFLGATGSSNFDAFGYVTAYPVGAMFGRFAFYTADIDTFRVEKGERLLKRLSDVTLDKKNIANFSVSADESEYFEQVQTVNLFNSNDANVLLTGYYNLSNVFTTHATLGQTGYIEVTAGELYTDNFRAGHVLWFDNTKTFLSATNSASFASYGYVEAVVGAAYARFVFTKANVATYQVQKGIESTSYEDYGYKYVLQQKYLQTVQLLTVHALNSKKLTYFGDSLAFRQSWQQPVLDYFGLIGVNTGIGSTALAGATSNAFWQDVRLNAVKASDPDVLTICGGANDLALNILIGDDAEFNKVLADKNKTTFKGAYSYIIENLLTWKPSLRIIILGTPWAHNNGANLSHTTGLTYTDFSDASREVAQYYGLPCVDLHGEMGLNKMTTNLLTTDNIHWSAAGGKRVAELVIEVFEKIKLL